jgi:hypothetical protein
MQLQLHPHRQLVTQTNRQVSWYNWPWAMKTTSHLAARFCSTNSCFSNVMVFQTAQT